MSKIAYKRIRFNKSSQLIIAQADSIVEEYQNQGFNLTLRQLYYQFVSRDLVPNNLQSYKRLGSIINDARLAGLLDWEAIEDRTRELSRLSTWGSPSEIIRACSQQFRVDFWENQPVYLEVWIEKEALAGVVETVCNQYRIPFLSCRGYTSQSEMWRAGQRLNTKSDKQVFILHLGDHDPSGIDMSRDIQDRLHMFTDTDFGFLRLALNMEQVKQYNPPPNFAKQTDSRFRDYETQFGQDSWELDALEPKVITGLIQNTVETFIDKNAWQESMDLEAEHQKTLLKLAKKADK